MKTYISTTSNSPEGTRILVWNFVSKLVRHTIRLTCDVNTFHVWTAPSRHFCLNQIFTTWASYEGAIYNLYNIGQGNSQPTLMYRTYTCQVIACVTVTVTEELG